MPGHATLTGEHDVAARLERVLRQAGLRVAVLRPTVPTLKRELWYEKQLRGGVEVVICHRSWSRRVSIFWHSQHSTSMKPAIRSTRCDRPHGGRGASAEASGAGKVLRLEGHYTDHVSATDGEEDAGGADDGGQVLGRRHSFSRERRRHDACSLRVSWSNAGASVSRPGRSGLYTVLGIKPTIPSRRLCRVNQ